MHLEKNEKKNDKYPLKKEFVYYISGLVIHSTITVEKTDNRWQQSKFAAISIVYTLIDTNEI